MGGLRCGQALVWVENSGEGEGRPPSLYGLASVGGPVLPGGCVRLEPPICAPLPPPVSSFPSLLWGYSSCHISGIPAAWAPAGAVETLPARAPQPEPPPRGEPAPHSSSRLPVGQPPPGCSPPPSLRVDSGCPPGKTESEEQTWALCDTGRQALTGGAQALLAADLGLLPSRGIETHPFCCDVPPPRFSSESRTSGLRPPLTRTLWDAVCRLVGLSPHSVWETCLLQGPAPWNLF